MPAHGKVTHGMSKSRTYRIYSSMKTRCDNPNAIQYADYGGRGIKVCDRWNESFQHFLEDMGECPNGLSIDRVNNDKGYEPSNCQWATVFQQSRNKQHTIWTTFHGEKISIRELADKFSIYAPTLIHRIRNLGMNAEDAIVYRKHSKPGTKRWGHLGNRHAPNHEN